MPDKKGPDSSLSQGLSIDLALSRTPLFLVVRIIRCVGLITTNNGDITNYIGIIALSAETYKREILGA